MDDQNTQLGEYRKEILYSWKSIANFLSRSVRTARRWEETEALPVRRHKHLKNNTVYAYVSELEEWRKQRENLNASNVHLNIVNNTKNEQSNFWKNITAWLS